MQMMTCFRLSQDDVDGDDVFQNERQAESD